MSTLKVEVIRIENILVHENADKLEIVEIKGWQCISSKGNFSIGDKAVYFPIDSILPEELEMKIFGPESKIKLHNHRIRATKIRGVVSYGLLTRLSTVGIDENTELGVDLTGKLGIKKHEEVEANSPHFKGNIVKKRSQNPLFHKYTDIENFKNHNKLFEPEDEVVITEKIHGSNAAFGLLPFAPITFWDKVKKFFGFTDEYQYVIRSHNIQLSLDKTSERNVYIEAFKKYRLDKVLKRDEIIYGEIYGAGVQKNYLYDCRSNERKFVIFDIKQNGKFLDFKEFADRSIEIFKSIVVDTVKTVYAGKFKDANLEELVKGPSTFSANQKIKEGLVIKPLIESESHMGRKILKYINPEYLLGKNNTEFH